VTEPTEEIHREAVALVIALRSGELEEEQLSEVAVRLDGLLPDPNWYSYTIDQVPELTAEEVVRRAFSYRPI